MPALSGGRDLDLLLHEAKAAVVPFTVEQSEIARGAYRKFGKGRHPAALNFGDCCTYALAKVSGEALLCKGNDFPQTDIRLTSLDPG
jgi:ribonuclease VapC